MTRVIESTSRRVVHFTFNPETTSTVSPFTRNFKLLLTDELENFEQIEREKLEKYLENYVEEILDENEKYPVVFEKNDFFELELNQID